MYLVAVDCTTNATEKYLVDDDVNKVKIEDNSDLDSECMSVLNTLIEEGYEDKSVAGDVEMSQCMDNRKLSEKDVSEVKGERLAEMNQRLLEDEISEHLIKRLIHVLVPQIREKCVRIVNVIVQKCLKQHTGDQVGDVPVAQCWRGAVP